MTTRFAHVNVIARDWRRLAAFYKTVFGCQVAPPERDQHGDWLDRAIGVTGAHLRGAHLRLPGGGEDGPTLEIYEYEPTVERPTIQPNTPGFSHIAFAVDDVAATADAVLANGGSALGDLTEREIAGVGRLTFRYVADPEGNIIELQSWT